MKIKYTSFKDMKSLHLQKYNLILDYSPDSNTLPTNTHNTFLPNKVLGQVKRK